MRSSKALKAAPLAALPLALLALATAPAAHADGKRECTNDGSLSFEFCAELKYDEVRDGDRRFVKVSRARADVRLKDPQVQIKRVTLGGNVLGRCLTTCGDVGALDLGGRLGVSAGKGRRTVISRRTPWSKWYTQVGGASHSCVIIIVDWSRGTKDFRSLHDRCIGAPFDTLTLADREEGFSKIGKIRSGH